MKLEDYIKDLDSDLQEKARACGSVDELLALARDSKVPLPDEVLEAVAGGDGPDPENCGDPTCPQCGSTNLRLRVEPYEDSLSYHYTCKDCGYTWVCH